MTDVVESEIERTVADWKTEAKRRRAISSVDPVADAIDYCASDIVQRIANARIADGEWITVEAYAALPDVDRTPQTVRAWIRAGLLPARPTARGYLIRKDARRTIEAQSA